MVRVPIMCGSFYALREKKSSDISGRIWWPITTFELCNETELFLSTSCCDYTTDSDAFSSFLMFLLTLLIAPLSMVLLRVALFSLSLVVGKVASPMLLR